MAAACGLARTRFAELVREVTGETPIRLLNRARVRRARQLLVRTDRSITEIAHACGFASSQYFATVFRQFTGRAPASARRNGSGEGAGAAE
jgi:AraC-like DNA-binding protein